MVPQLFILEIFCGLLPCFVRSAIFVQLRSVILITLGFRMKKVCVSMVAQVGPLTIFNFAVFRSKTYLQTGHTFLAITLTVWSSNNMCGCAIDQMAHCLGVISM